jgi:prepilin-type N-terminal cleavage/methylation domain-containing protein
MRPTSHIAAQRGFTLIELSIVLVIIGLIIGGVLVGQTLVEQATYRKIGKEAESFRTAFNTYKLKYGFMPGDDPNAAQAFGSDPACTVVDGSGNYYNYVGIRPYIATPNGLTCSGGGNNKIDGDYYQEYGLIWQHLAMAKLIGGNFTGTCAWTGANCASNAYTFNTLNAPLVTQTNATFKSVWVPFNPMAIHPWWNLNSWGFRAGHRMFFGMFELSSVDGAGVPISSNAFPALGTTPMQASSIDRKFDDGAPNTGDIMHYTNTGASDSCVNVSGSTITYRTTLIAWAVSAGQRRGCGLMFSSGF